MMSKRIFIYAVFLLLIVYTYSMMNTFLSSVSNYWTILSPMIIVFISTYFMLTSTIRYSRFSRFWVIWIVWVVFEALFGKIGAEKGNIFRMLLPPMSFMFFYISSVKDIRANKKVIEGFVILFLLSLYWSIQYSLTSIAEFDFLQTNYVFWPLCCAPFIFLVNNKKLKWVLIGLMVAGIVISMKRSAVIIALLTILLTFLSRGRDFKRTISIMVLLIVGYFIFNMFFSDYMVIIQDRMEMMSSDEGSGRIDIFEVVWNAIKEFHIDEIIIGKGFGTITATGHTNAHNDVLQMLYEYGLIGLILYAVLLYRVIKQFQMVSKRQDVSTSVVISVGSSFIILLVMGLVSNIVVGYTFFVFLCCLWGYIEGQYFCASNKIVKS